MSISYSSINIWCAQFHSDPIYQPIDLIWSKCLNSMKEMIFFCILCMTSITYIIQILFFYSMHEFQLSNHSNVRSSIKSKWIQFECLIQMRRFSIPKYWFKRKWILLTYFFFHISDYYFHRPDWVQLSIFGTDD